MGWQRLVRARPQMSPGRAAAVAVTALAVTASGFAATPAQSLADPSCPTPYPLSQIQADDAVTGLTVVRGTEPVEFKGTVLGVLNDGIAPDVDMIMVRVTLPAAAEVTGIWEGMSGSPVYATDGRLVGAVAYGLSTGPSAVAGVTPAAEMEKLLSNQPAETAPSDTVAIPRAMARKMITTGAATAAEVNGGMAPLRVPFGISGMSTSKRLQQATKMLQLDNVRMLRVGATSANAKDTDIIPGGNMAASMSYGDITTAGVGTVTAVCGNEVLGFGHPFSQTGPASLTLHGASAVYIQGDPTLTPFKVANISGPVGTVTDDRLAGLRGVLPKSPVTANVTSTVRVGSASRVGTTHISVPEAVPDLAAMHLFADQDRVFDGAGKGSSTVGWTIRGRRENGAGFSLVRTDRFADPSDISFASAVTLYDQLSQIQDNGIEDVKITSVTTSSQMTRSYAHYTIGRVQVRQGGRWVRVNPNGGLLLRARTVKKFKVTLTSRTLRDRTVVVSVPVPRRAPGKFGFLEITGGNTLNNGGDDGEGFSLDAPGDAPSSFPALLGRLRRAPHNEDVVASLNFMREDGSAISRTRRGSAHQVVDGSFAVQVLGVR